MVVPVLMTSCQGSLKPKSGPVIAHTTTIRTAARNTTGFLHQSEVLRAKLSNQSVVLGSAAFCCMGPSTGRPAQRSVVPTRQDEQRKRPARAGLLDSRMRLCLLGDAQL